jgi:hypothetical protein
MDTPALKKGTRAAVRIVPQLDLDGSMVAVVLVKEKFVVDPRGQVAPTHDAEIHLVDVPWDEDKPETSSIKFPADVCLRKPSTDVLVVGSAMAKDRAKSRELDVLVRVGPVERALRVFGTRAWYRGVLGVTLSEPLPFEALPLRWEYAYGGSDFSDPDRPLEEPRNPVGRGVCRQAEDLIDTPGPQIEDPADLITKAKQKRPPAGVGAIGRHWLPRRLYTGTIDDHWKRERMPLLPADFDDRFNQAAPPELITPEPLRGGERVQLLNLCPEGVMQFELPRVHHFVGARTDAGMTEHRTQLDTVLLLPNEHAFELTWRATVPLPRKQAALRFVQVHDKVVL